MPAPKSSPSQKHLKIATIVVFLLAVGVLLFPTFKMMLMKDKPVVVIVGDSNSDPQSITQVKKWSEDYAEAHKKDQVVVNYSVGGHAAEDFTDEELFLNLKALSKTIPPDSPVILITFLGTNNAIMANKLQTPENYVATYGLFLEKISAIIQPKYIVLTLLPPTFPNPDVKVPFPMNLEAAPMIGGFNIALADWIQKQPYLENGAHLKLVSILPNEAYEAQYKDTYLLNDGVHLNRTAQLIIFQKINALVNELVQSAK